MHPPVATGKNDHLPGLQSRRKSSFTEKEVLAENKRSLQQHPEEQLRTAPKSALISSESDDFLCFKSQPAKFDQFLAKRHSNSSGSSDTNSSVTSFSSCQNYSPNTNLLDGTHCDILTTQPCQKEQLCLTTSNNVCISAFSEQKSDILSKSQIRRNSKVTTRKVALQDSFQTLKSAIDTQSDNEYNTKLNGTKASERSILNVPRNLFVNNFDFFSRNYECDNAPQVNSLQKLETVVNLPLSETSPLLTSIETTIVDPKRSIFLNKNSASLIFTKKDPCKNNFNSTVDSYNQNPNIGCKTDKKNNGGAKKGFFGSSQSIDNSNNKCKNPALVHRQSLQVNYFPVISRESGICHSVGTTKRSNTAANNRRQHAYSWYAPVYSALEEEFEQDSRDSSPIHKVAETQQGLQDGSEFRETSSLLNPADTAAFESSPLHQSRILRQTSSTPTSNVAPSKTSNSNSGSHTQVHNEPEGPHAISLLGGPLPRRKRFENFLKSLVGRKPSKETIASPPLLPSPEIKATNSPSTNNLSQIVDGPIEKITSSTASLNSVQQKLWNVVPLLKRESSVTSLNHEKVQHCGLRKCETVLALSRSTVSVEPIKPQNRLRTSVSTSNANCSRCSSLLSLAASGSRYSLNLANSGFVTVSSTTNNGSKCQLKQVHPTLQTGSTISSSIESANCAESVNGKCGSGPEISSKNSLEGARQKTSSSLQLHTPSSTTPVAAMAVISQPSEMFRCKLCLADVETSAATTIEQCGCFFCTECMKTYVEFEISEGAYEISCPDAQCPQQGIISLAEMSALAAAESMNKHQRYRLNREIELDKSRTWCPRPGCETVCVIGPPPATPSSSADRVNLITPVFCGVRCPTCKEEFCSGCKKPWHASLTCEENSRRLGADGPYALIGIPFDNDLIKYCPMCAVPIEKDEGCAQMMCKRCKHVFCWYCLASLDDDFLLRHYDKGPCKNKLGHSRASVVWHRAQVIGIFAGFGILLLVASPLLLLAAPCIICCKCSICSGSEKLEDPDADFDDAVALQR